MLCGILERTMAPKNKKKKRVLVGKNLNKAHSSVSINLFSFDRYYRRLHKCFSFPSAFSCLRDRHLILIVLSQQR